MWDLNLAAEGEDVELASPGTYGVVLKGKGFEETREFVIEKMKWN